MEILKWHFFSRNHENEEVACVFYAGVTTEDLTIPTGKLISSQITVNNDSFLGREFSGTCGNRRIMGLTEHGALSLNLKIHPYYSWEIPNHWSLQEAATVPAAYVLVSIF